MPVEDNEENKNKCTCPDCPSFPADCQSETLYCARGKSQCQINNKGCICPSCPVQIENDLGDAYYCSQGKAD